MTPGFLVGFAGAALVLSALRFKAVRATLATLALGVASQLIADAVDLLPIESLIAATPTIAVVQDSRLDIAVGGVVALAVAAVLACRKRKATCSCADSQ